MIEFGSPKYEDIANKQRLALRQSVKRKKTIRTSPPNDHRELFSKQSKDYEAAERRESLDLLTKPMTTDWQSAGQTWQETVSKTIELFEAKSTTSGSKQTLSTAIGNQMREVGQRGLEQTEMKMISQIGSKQSESPIRLLQCQLRSPELTGMSGNFRVVSLKLFYARKYS